MAQQQNDRTAEGPNKGPAAEHQNVRKAEGYRTAQRQPLATAEAKMNGTTNGAAAERQSVSTLGQPETKM